MDDLAYKRMKKEMWDAAMKYSEVSTDLSGDPGFFSILEATASLVGANLYFQTEAFYGNDRERALVLLEYFNERALKTLDAGLRGGPMVIERHTH